MPERRSFIINLDECPSPLDGGKSGSTAKHAFHQKGARHRAQLIMCMQCHRLHRLPPTHAFGARVHNRDAESSTAQMDPGKTENMSYMPAVTLDGEFVTAGVHQPGNQTGIAWGSDGSKPVRRERMGERGRK